MSNFNVNLLHYVTHSQSRVIFDKMFSTPLYAHIIILMRVTQCSKTLIDNIFTNSTNSLDDNSVCGNLTCSISDHVAQFLIYTSKPYGKQF